MIRKTLFAAAALPLAACASFIAPEPTAAPEAIRAGAYENDPAHTAFLFKIDHLGLSKYVGRFKDVEASLDFDESDPRAARLEAIIDMTSLFLTDPDFAEQLKGPAWFNVETHPQAVFRSEAVRVTGENEGVVSGTLTLLGVSKPVEMRVIFNGGARNLLTRRYTLGFAAYGSFKRSDFGLDRFSDFVGDEVEFEIHIEFLRT